MVHVIGNEELEAEIPTDLRLDEDRQVGLGPENDLEPVGGLAAVGQSLVIRSGNVLRPLIGGPVTGQQLERVQDELLRTLRNDIQIENVQRVEIDEVNRSTETIDVTVFVGLNNEFTLPVEL